MQTVEEVRTALQSPEGRVTSLASLIRLGIEDGRKMLVERQDVRPDYAVWYRRRSIEGTCTACLAGGVMLGTLAELGKHRLEDCDLINSHALQIMYSRHQVNALCALDRVRQGNIEGAYRSLGLWNDFEFRGALDKVLVARTVRSRVSRQGPTDSQFTSRGLFASHLDSLDELASELEEVEQRGEPWA